MSALACEGFEFWRGVFTRAELDALLASLPAESSRHLLDCPAIAALAQDPRLRALVEPNSFAVRGLLFDKTPSANWSLSWHQDLAIAVRERRDVAGFGPWTVKGGVPHVNAPTELLDRMISLRVHLDDCGVNDGPLRVIAGSHLGGRLGPGAASAGTEHPCLASAGDVLAFRPLLLHASAPFAGSGHRRVVQLEFAGEALPGGLKWHWQV